MIVDLASAEGEARPPVRLSALITGLECGVLRCVEIAAGILVAVEIGILFWAVAARYWLHDPQTWTDETAGALFLWLAMLGSVSALGRGEHMRLTAFVAMLPPGVRKPVEVFGTLVVLLFLAQIVWPAVAYLDSQAAITNPALHVSDAWRVCAILLGVVLMLFLTLLGFIRTASLPQMAGSLVVVGTVALVLHLAAPFLIDIGNVNLFVFFVLIVLIAVLASVPIGFAFGIATVSYLLIVTEVPLVLVINRMDMGMSHLLLLSVPLFVYLGLLIEATGMARAMVGFLASLLGHLRGGLEYVLLAAMYLVSGISGSKAADMAAVAPILFPEMKKRGRDEGEMIGLLSASGAMSETIPPSLVVIALGSVTGVSITALFAGGLLPALVATIALVIAVRLRGRHIRVDTLPKRASWSEVWWAFLLALPGLILPLLIRFAVLEGITTATEVSTLGVVYALFIGLCTWRQVAWHRMWPILVETASLSGAILFIIGTATAMAWALTQSGFSYELVNAIRQMPGGAIGFLAISMVVFIIVGSLLEGIPAVIVFAPLLFPVARAVGVDEVHYSMVIILAMGVGLFAPPFGVGFYAACAIGKVSPDAAMNKTWPYLAAVVVALVVVAAVPWLSTALVP